MMSAFPPLPPGEGRGEGRNTNALNREYDTNGTSTVAPLIRSR